MSQSKRERPFVSTRLPQFPSVYLYCTVTENTSSQSHCLTPLQFSDKDTLAWLPGNRLVAASSERLLCGIA